MDFCLIIIPRLDIIKVIAKEDKKKTTRLIFTETGEFIINFIKSFFKILKNSKRYIRFSMEVIRPRIPGASKNKGRNQRVKNLSGKG